MLSAIIFVVLFYSCQGYVYVTPTRLLHSTRLSNELQSSKNVHESPPINDESSVPSWDRRSVVTSFLSPLVLLPLDVAHAGEKPPQQQDFDCLLDLPPIPNHCVRVYLCRHGQTENNRLRKVQGARVDPPINDNGILQAQGLGRALARVVPCPELITHSKLTRARMTAEVAAGQMSPTVDTSKVLEDLGEVDFGPAAEGQPITIALAGMAATYSAWALGDIDYRPEGGGDSGREVLVRAAEALRSLAQEAKSSNGCVAAVSHSTYLRVLLTMLLDDPLRDSPKRSIVNGAINVVDIKKDGSSRRLGPNNTKLFSGGRVPNDFHLEIPICNVVRVNEARHLPVL